MSIFCHRKETDNLCRLFYTPTARWHIFTTKKLLKRLIQRNRGVRPARHGGRWGLAETTARCVGYPSMLVVLPLRLTCRRFCLCTRVTLSTNGTEKLFDLGVVPLKEPLPKVGLKISASKTGLKISASEFYSGVNLVATENLRLNS